jgi:AAA+ ATPase superfamily predicted ATPase
MKNVKKKDLFNPRFGLRPDLFLGRKLELKKIFDAQKTPNSPYRTTFVTGLRGSGKTSLLSDIALDFEKNGEIVVSVSETDDMLAAIIDQLVLKSGDSKNSISGITAAALGFSFGITLSDKAQTHSFRGSLGKILASLKKQGKSPIILIDEASGTTDGMREFASTYQLLAREGLDMLVVMAGLPSAVSEVLSSKVLTFLYRAGRIKLEPLPMDEVVDSYLRIFTEKDQSIDYSLVKELSSKTYGFPYLYQLIGYYVMELSNEKIDANIATIAIERAKELFFENVLDILMRDTTERERDFLFAMLKDREASKFGDISDRMHVSKGYAVKYRQRLLDAMLVESAGYGKLRYAPPMFAQYLSKVQEDY